MIRLWDNAWEEFIPFLDYDVEIRRVICSTNSIESLNARHRRAIKARGHFPSEQVALKCLYLVTRSLTHRDRPGPMDDAAETGPERVRNHLRRPIPGSRNLLMETAGNTVNEIVPDTRGRTWGRCGDGVVTSDVEPPVSRRRASASGRRQRIAPSVGARWAIELWCTPSAVEMKSAMPPGVAGPSPSQAGTGPGTGSL